MKNKTSMIIPKKYHDKIDYIDVEHSDVDGSPVYWMYLKRGWCFDDEGLHVISELTQKELKGWLQTIHPCECYDCITGNGW